MLQLSSVLATSGPTADSLLIAFGVGAAIAVLTAQRNKTLSVSQPAAIVTCITARYRAYSYAKPELQHRRNLWATKPGSAWRTFFSKLTTPD
jgi:hypothetical protein